mmetsp:Transcript_4067/g.7860  ORF Transcript_4067/g.7860 Transcript_4067/m.7860 type:complete len:142 (-) Transcript_4067:321-746(-)|eukprot:CAMPEP_0175149044 /NCGR_PEP_ID=MMETSP0087-20121206/16998_1 /TAXON_ID=136419 /ORGANISM="Unknown Unknown, Strain D1" /LENGTH=141 /DNA_ID=CAMNT_0016434639 /DNA_START=41 /DNA_END=466 /DNA_ORIENTATION=+
MALVPSFKWAQDFNRLFLTIEVADVKNASVKIEKGSLHFSGESDGKQYSLNFGFFKPVDPSGSSYSTKGREVEVLLAKATQDEEFWDHILDKEHAKTLKQRCSPNWDLWRDEDDEEEKNTTNFGIGGDQFDDETDSDDEDA